MLPKVVSLQEKFGLFDEQWSPKIIARMNDYDFKIAKLQGEFIWHQHANTDETFFVIKGELTILFRDGQVTLQAGEMTVVPAGVEHKPVAENECQVMLIEPSGTANTGDTQTSERTSTEGEWL